MLNKIRKILYRSFDNREISYKKLKDLIQKDKNAILLDVRSKQEYTEEHLNNAINIPIYDLEQEVDKVLTNKQANIIIYCTSGYRSKKAKMILEEMEYENVYSLKNGLDGI